LFPFVGKGKQPVRAGIDAEIAEAAPLDGKIECRTGDFRRAGDDPFRAGVPTTITLTALRFPSGYEAGRTDHPGRVCRLPGLLGWQEYPSEGEEPLREKLLA
jgi:hypothetical protein